MGIASFLFLNYNQQNKNNFQKHFWNLQLSMIRSSKIEVVLREEVFPGKEEKKLSCSIVTTRLTRMCFFLVVDQKGSNGYTIFTEKTVQGRI